MIIDLDGQTVHAATGGVAPDGDDPIVLLVHGAGMDGTVWQLQTRYLAHHGYRPMAIDLPGHGRSSGDPIASVPELADWLGTVVDALDEGPVAVVGHSMGSFIGLELAARRPEAVTSLVLMGTAAAMPVHPDLLDAAENDLPAAAALMASWGHAKPAHIGLNPTPGLWMIGGARALVEVSASGALAVDFRACAAYDGAEAAAAEVACPVTILVGAEDKMTPPRAAAALAAHVPQASVITVPDTGHMMMIEDPRLVRVALLDALTAVTPAPEGQPA
ncbi:MAG: alpha/beta hydrolase [Actinomycetota bacterium]